MRVAKNLYRGYDNLNLPVSNPRAIELVCLFDGTLNWMQTNVPKVQGVTTSATTLAAIGRAYLFYRTNTRKIGILKQVCEVLETGQYEKLDPDEKLAKLEAEEEEAEVA